MAATATATRNWTDAQDAIAYDTFSTIAAERGGPVAVDVMYGFMKMGATYSEVDIKAWILRYEDEADAFPKTPSWPIDREYARKFDRYHSIRRS